MSSTIWSQRCTFFLPHATGTILNLTWVMAFLLEAEIIQPRYIVSWWFTFTEEACGVQKKGWPIPTSLRGGPEHVYQMLHVAISELHFSDRYVKWSWLPDHWQNTDVSDGWNICGKWAAFCCEHLRKCAGIFPHQSISMECFRNRCISSSGGWVLSNDVINFSEQPANT